jgi:hypothetical protein
VIQSSEEYETRRWRREVLQNRACTCGPPCRPDGVFKMKFLKGRCVIRLRTSVYHSARYRVVVSRLPVYILLYLLRKINMRHFLKIHSVVLDSDCCMHNFRMATHDR